MCLCARVRESGDGGGRGPRGGWRTAGVGKGEGWMRDKPKAGKQSEEEEPALSCLRKRRWVDTIVISVVRPRARSV